MSTKTKNVIVWILSGLLAFVFLGAGISKIMGVEMQIQNLESWGYPLWFRFPIGFGEIVLAVALLIPSFRRLAIYAVFAWALVAIFTHLQADPPQYNMLGGAITFAIINTILLFVEKSKSRQLA